VCDLVLLLSVSHTRHKNHGVGSLSRVAAAEHLQMRKSSAYESLTRTLRHKIVYILSFLPDFLANELEKQDRNAILDSNCKCTHKTANLVKTFEIKYLNLKI
jgi:hypothetical protein